jgi:GH24 family phage-related lysozyme (muramidase)
VQTTEVPEQITPELQEEIMNRSGLDITLAEEDIFPNDTMASTYIKSKEGFLSTPEWDVNHWTWGYGTAAPHDGGRNEPPPSDLTITRDEAQEELINYMGTEVLNKLKAFEEKHNYTWNNNQIAALTSFMFNGKPHWLRQVTDNGTRTNEKIAEAMLLYHNVDDGSGKLVPSQGLITRREEEVTMFLGGIGG